jgi:hypothetical protein
MLHKMNRLSFRKYNATIKVLLSAENPMRDPVYPNEVQYLPGYYRPVSVYASSEGDAIAELRKSITDGRIDWSCSELVEVEKRWRDRLRMLAGRRITFQGGRVFFPSKKDEVQDESPLGWSLGKPQQ